MATKGKILCLWADFYWTDRELAKAKKLYDDGLDLIQMSRKLKRPVEEVLFMIVDRVRAEKFEPRKLL